MTMRCASYRELENAYIDGELQGRADDVRDHLAHCAGCFHAHAELSATSRRVREGLERFSAPDVLKARIRSAIAAEAQPTLPVQEPRRALESVVGRAPLAGRWRRLAAAAVWIAIGSSAATYGIVREDSGVRTLRDDVLASHVRSLMPGHLTDVASNDKHNVKPWFNGRIDLSPPVPRFDESGFVLDGGRLDYIAGHTVAAVVYSHGQHVINVFSWPESGDDTQPSTIAAHGYHLVSWRRDRVAFWAASDLDVHDLTQFITLFQRGDAPAAR